MVATQLPLFGAVVEARPRHIRAVRSRHVLYDPGVSEAGARSAHLGCDLRSAFASFWASLPPERRDQLRALVAA